MSKKEGKMGKLGFKGMAFVFSIRDMIVHPGESLEEAGIAPGDTILDFGCGPGSFSIAAAKLVGGGGKIYALDILPVVEEVVKRKARKRGLTNIETIVSDRETGLPDESVDVIILYDVFHSLRDTNGVLKELHRILKSDGVLSFSDHHLKEDKVISGMTGSGLFELKEKGKRTYSFVKSDR